jgi:hypothetical protein
MDATGLKKLRIAYAPNSPDFSEPGDRRRFSGYANDRELTYEIADINKEYDIVILTYHCDIPAWIKYKKQRGEKTRLIFELVDSYLKEGITLKSRFRGLFKYLDGSCSKLYPDYRKAITDICKVADAIVCTTEEQMQDYLPYNDNVHIILDTSDDDILLRKTDYSTGEKIKLVWEGQSYTISNLFAIKDVLHELKDKIELHVITNLEYYKIAKKYFKRDTRDLLSFLECPTIFHPWRSETFSEIVSSCDIAIIPINLDDDLAASKSENKLILFSHIAIPVLASPTPAYIRTMKDAGLEEYLCLSGAEWSKKILSIAGMRSEERKLTGDLFYEYAKSHHTKQHRLEQWDKALLSVF